MSRPKGSKNKKTIEKELKEKVIQEEKNINNEIENPTEKKEPEQEQKKELGFIDKLESNMFIDEYAVYKDIEFTYKKYLPINSKEIFVRLVVDNCFIKEKDKIIFNHMMRELITGYNILIFYTDLDFENTDLEISEIYDLAKKSGLLDFIKSKIPYEELEFLDKEIIQEIKIKYPEYDGNKKGFIEIIGDFFNKISDDIPGAIDEIKNFNPDKFGNIMEIIDKFDKYNNPSKYKKSKKNN